MNLNNGPITNHFKSQKVASFLAIFSFYHLQKRNRAQGVQYSRRNLPIVSRQKITKMFSLRIVSLSLKALNIILFNIFPLERKSDFIFISRKFCWTQMHWKWICIRQKMVFHNLKECLQNWDKWRKNTSQVLKEITLMSFCRCTFWRQHWIKFSIFRI